MLVGHQRKSITTPHERDRTMRTMLACIALIAALPLAAQGQEWTDPASAAKPAFPQSGRIELYKDPMVAGYLSATMPGLGQMYVGKKGRGFMFLAGIVGAFGSAYAFAEPAGLDLADYDKTVYGGDGDGFLSTGEIKRWEGREADGDAFGNLSTGRKVGAITGVVAGIGLYIWNIMDARSQAQDHNRVLAQRGIGLGFQDHKGRPGLAMNLRF
jgi:TM2 domain-containing membrane protein YozV